VSADTVHATAVAVDGLGVILSGPSGAGKSDLAMRLIDRGATLVADDRVVLTSRGGALLLSAPPPLAGLIEVRALGLVRLPATDAPLALWVDLGAEGERLPPPRFRQVAGRAVRFLALDARAPSAPLKIEWALRRPPEVVE